MNFIHNSISDFTEVNPVIAAALITRLPKIVANYLHLLYLVDAQKIFKLYITFYAHDSDRNISYI